MTLSRLVRDVGCRRAGRDRAAGGGLTIRPRARFGVCAAVAVLVALVVVVLGAGGSGAAARRPLVSNLLVSNLCEPVSDPCEPASVLLTQHFDVAQGFRTGGLGSGYVLDSVEVQVVVVSGSAVPVVTLHKDDPDSVPVASLSVPSTLTRNSPVVFGAPAGTVLELDSTYYVVIGEGGASGYVGVAVTGSGKEVADPGWEVLDRVLRRAAGSAGAFDIEGDGAVRIRVNGEYTAVEALVGNVGQSAGSSESLELYDVAQGFDTGSGGHGWALDGIDVVLSEVSDTEELSVTLHAGNPTRAASARTAVAALTARGSLAVGVNSFDAPGGTVLDPDAGYFVVVQGRGHGVSLISSDGEDSPRRAGWSVHDARHRRAHNSTGAFAEQPVASLGIRVRGTALVPGELSALEVVGRGGDALAWAQGAFAPATTVYSADVANAVLTVTVTATPEPGSTAVITCGNGFPATGSGLCPLVVGDNVLTVDAGSAYGAEKTYRLSVVRAEGSAEPVVRRLVSNIDEHSDGGALTTVDADIAQGFKTGALGSGYVLDSIEIRVEFAGRRPEPSVTLHKDDPTGAEVATLEPAYAINPNDDAAIFVPSPDGTVVVLEPDSAYYVVVQEDVAAEYVAVGVTLSGGEEADPGWEMLDLLIRAADSTGPFDEGIGAVRIRVNGEYTEVEARVGISALGLADSDGNPLMWTQGAFDPATTGYSTGVAYAVSAVTVTATPEPRSTATITCPDRTATGLCPLAVGVNVFTVDVVSPFGVRAYGLYIERAKPGEPAPTAVAVPVPEVSLSFTGLGITEHDGVISFNEDISNVSSFDVNVSLSEVTPHRVTARVFTADGTARSPADFTAIDQTLVFAPGETSTTVAVGVVNDGLVEYDETFTVSLGAVSAAATLGSDASVEVTIRDDDAANLRFDRGTYQLTEGGPAVVAKVVVRTPGSLDYAEVPLYVHVVMVDGTAVAGKDYVEDHFTLTLEPGESETRSFEIFAVDDAIRESGRETFSIRLEKVGSFGRANIRSPAPSALLTMTMSRW